MKKNYLTQAERSQFTLSADLKAILFGLLLGDLCANKEKRSVNARLLFSQGTIHNEYLFHLYDLFKHYCLTEPKVSNRSPDKRTGKIYTSVSFNTRALPCFNELYDLFYPEGKKVVPLDIEDLLTPLGLAYWICDDGKYVDSGGLRLCTNSYSIQDVTRLKDVLITHYGLICTIHKTQKGQHLIFISKNSMDKLRSIVKQHMVPNMLYKIHL